MIHPVAFALAALACVAVAALFYSRWLRSLPNPTTLSEAVRELVNQSDRMPLEPQLTRSFAIPLRDGLSIYSNSRLLLATAHRLWLDGSQGLEERALYEIALETHTDIARNYRWYLLERAASIVMPERLPVYSLLLAEKYSEAIEVVKESAERSGNGQAMLLVMKLA